MVQSIFVVGGGLESMTEFLFTWICVLILLRFGHIYVVSILYRDVAIFSFTFCSSKSYTPAHKFQWAMAVVSSNALCR